jgi:Flp pilus assembly protein CpaB
VQTPETRVLSGCRKRKLRRAAIVLAGLIVLSVFSQMLHRGAAGPAVVPVVVTRHEVRPGEMLHRTDLEVIVAAAVPRPHAPGPVTGVPFTHVEDAIGRIAFRGLRNREIVASENTIPVLEFYGVSSRIPPGMRAVNLVVPPAAVFGGELTPRSRVDLVAAFAVGQERTATILLGSGIVLRVFAGHGRVGDAGGLARTGALSADDAEVADGRTVEVEVAIPASREREVVLAQAFGRIFLAVHSAVAGISSPASPGPLHLRQYLELQSEVRVSSPSPTSPWPPTLPAEGSAVGPHARRGDGSVRRVRQVSVSSAHSRETKGSPPQTPHARESVPGAMSWIVEVIGGGTRSFEVVPRESASPDQESVLPPSPSGRSQ